MMQLSDWLSTTWSGGFIAGFLLGVVIYRHRVEIYNRLYDRFRRDKKKNE